MLERLIEQHRRADGPVAQWLVPRWEATGGGSNPRTAPGLLFKKRKKAASERSLKGFGPLKAYMTNQTVKIQFQQFIPKQLYLVTSYIVIVP